ncbi:hypothetical protein [Chitinolyticbacter meiyuanensis]|uniref:hypothetical protein n=1 Tax=Chitinolyticbacter meiyuanensis TaxID=682798 RepID=UPI0011E5D4A8|nr:hypothetical protein [Chitinolyticbacter meiyuanensis]
MHTSSRMRPVLAASAACIALVAPVHAAPFPTGYARAVAADSARLAATPLTLDAAIRRALVAHPTLHLLYIARGIAPDALADTLTKQPSTLDVVRDVLGPLPAGDTLIPAVLAAVTDAQTAWYTLAAAQGGHDAAQQLQQAALASAELAEGQSDAGNLAEPELLAAQLAANHADAELGERLLQLQQARRMLATALDLPVTAALETTPMPALPGKPAWLGDGAALLALAHAGAPAFRLARQAESTAEARLSPRITSRAITLPLARSNVFTADDGERERWPTEQVAAHADLRALEDALIGAQQQAAQDWRQAELAAARQPLLAARTRATLQRYNGMLAGVDALLQAKQAQLAGKQDELQARRDTWIALAHLQALLGGQLPSSQPDQTGAQP